MFVVLPPPRDPCNISTVAAPPPPRTIVRLWREAVASGRPDPLYLAEGDGEWTPVSLADSGRRVDELANGLLALGVRKGAAFGILAGTRVEWCQFDFALALVGGVTAPVYANSSPDDCRYVLGHAGAVGVLVEDEDQREKVEAVRAELPELQHVLTFSDLEHLARRGREHAAAHPSALAEAESAISEDDLFTYIYTSGTTGPPKACMIRHRNYFEMADVVREMADVFREDDLLLLYLPLAHNFGRLVHLLAPHAGFTLAFCADPYAVADALVKVRPTVFPSVPRVYEKIHAAVVARFDAATGIEKRLIDWALGVGRRVSVLRQQGKPIPRGLAAQHRLADRLVYSKVKERLGGRLRRAVSGAAPLAIDILELFHALDILILEAYGLTECTSGATSNREEAFKFGTVGKALPGWELRLAEDGELFLRSPTVFAGYYKDEAATAAILDDEGWLATGDIATIDDDGFVTITDRKKDILVTAGGKNVAPQNLENELKSSRFVSQALVVGDRRPYVAALITLDPVEIAGWAESRGLDGDVAVLSEHPDVRELVQGVVDEVNAPHSRFEQIKRFAILPRDFSLDEGEMTPTLKMRRKICQEHFASEVEALYER
jgi:long-chain acyl-CoA synthetase